MTIMRNSFHADELLMLQVPLADQMSMEDSMNSSFPKDLMFRKNIVVNDNEVDIPEVPRPPISCVKPLKRKVSVKKSVSFNRTVRYREIPHLRDLSDECKSLIWETPRALDQIVKDAKDIASIMNFGLEVTEECGERGLYPMLHAERWKRTERRETIYQYIANLQAMQDDFWVLFEDGGNISEMIGRRCSYLSEYSRLEALNRAVEDEAAVRYQNA
jgi:hypothetical protein